MTVAPDTLVTALGSRQQQGAARFDYPVSITVTIEIAVQCLGATLALRVAVEAIGVEAMEAAEAILVFRLHLLDALLEGGKNCSVCGRKGGRGAASWGVGGDIGRCIRKCGAFRWCDRV